MLNLTHIQLENSLDFSREPGSNLIQDTHRRHSRLILREEEVGYINIDEVDSYILKVIMYIHWEYYHTLNISTEVNYMFNVWQGSLFLDYNIPYPEEFLTHIITLTLSLMKYGSRDLVPTVPIKLVPYKTGETTMIEIKREGPPSNSS